MTINGIQFDLYNYQKTADGIRMTINGATTAQLEEAIGDYADIVISDEFRGYGMKVASMFKKYGATVQHEISFVDSNLENAIAENAAELEVQAGAIAELAELIASVPEETEEVAEEEEE